MGWLKKLRRRHTRAGTVGVEGRSAEASWRPRHRRRRPLPAVHQPWPVGAGRPAWLVDDVEIALCAGGDELEVVGESAYQESLWSLVGRTGVHAGGRVCQDIFAVLVAEAGNKHDKHAVSVWVCGLKVGYLAREDARSLRPGLLRTQRAARKPIGLGGVVAGGGARADGRIGSLGVWLECDRTIFGVEPIGLTAPPDKGNLRTGLSAAIAGDLGDERYDLGWLGGLSDDAARRLTELSDLLAEETEPISRHFMMAELEAELYAFRDTFPAALVEYDEIAVRHDSEMDMILPALLGKFGRLPQLETYKQASVRHAKAKNLDVALWWAQRGVQIYGDDAHDDGWVADLHKRVATLQARIDRQVRARQRAKRSRGADVADALDDDAVGAALASGVTIAPAGLAGRRRSEELVCQQCGGTFTRVRASGRKPRTCADCRRWRSA